MIAHPTRRIGTATICLLSIQLSGAFAEQGIWRQHGFQDFSQGTFGNGGQNLYVSRAGVLQRIFQFDLNHDGFFDLVVCNSHGKDEGPPAFVYPHPLTNSKERLELAAGGMVTGAVADLNADSCDDIVFGVADNGVRKDLNSYIYFGSAGGFSDQRFILLPTPGCLSTTTGDFNGDGRTDIAFQLPKKLRIFYQSELGFEAKRFRELDIDGTDITSAELSGDKAADIVIRSTTGNVEVYWGAKDGITADSPARYDVPRSQAILRDPVPQGLAQYAESLQEALPRAAVVSIANTNYLFVPEKDRVSLVPVESARALGTPIRLACPEALAAATGDVDGDSRPDLVITTRQKDGENERSWIYWGNGSLPSDERRTSIRSRRACDVATADLDGDACDEIILCQYFTDDSYTSTSAIYRGSRDRKLTTAVELETGDARRVLLPRAAKGEPPQVAFVNRSAGDKVGNPNVYVYWGNGKDFDPERRLEVPAWGAVESLLADFNDDGLADLAIANCSEDSIARDPGSYVYLNSKSGLPHQPTLRLPTSRGTGMTCGDINHDGYLDFICTGFENPELRIFFGNEKGWDLEHPQRIELKFDGQVFHNPQWVYLVDLDADGWLELVVPMITDDRSLILKGGPDGYSIDRVMALAVERAASARAADLLGRGMLDLVLGGHNTTIGLPHDSFAYIYWNGPAGIRQDRRSQLPSAGTNSMSIADFNNDGTLDLYIGCYHGGYAREIDSYIYWNRKGRGFSADDRQRLFTHSASGSVAADFNEDGWIDLATAFHKVDGQHTGWSAVWWNGPKGFSEERVTRLPSIGPHNLTGIEPANQRDRGPEEFYESSAFQLPTNARPTNISWEADLPPKTWLKAQIRKAESRDGLAKAAWTGPTGPSSWFTKPQTVPPAQTGRWIQYRLALGATNAVASPRVREVSIEYAD